MDREDVRFLAEMIGTIFLVFVILFAVFLPVITLVSRTTCNEFAEMNPSYEIEWRFWNGCMVHTSSGLWMEVDEWENVQLEK